jgi:hypothetical protein
MVILLGLLIGLASGTAPGNPRGRGFRKLKLSALCGAGAGTAPRIDDQIMKAPAQCPAPRGPQMGHELRLTPIVPPSARRMFPGR